jgi:amino acid adenylation domain-containing protein
MNGLQPHLSQLLERAAARRPDHPAVEDEQGRTFTYAELAHAADRLATRLGRWGVGRGDRVGLFLPKTIEAVAAIHGILKAGAAYVPVDATAPAARGAGILTDAGVKAILCSGPLAPALRQAWPGPRPLPRLIITGGAPLAPSEAVWDEVLADGTPAPLAPERDPSDLAYILYTSGSTGQPKGVMHSHAGAFTFLDWCTRTFTTGADDRFAAHAPFHFDLSVFDLFVSCRARATLVLIGETLGKEPSRLGPFLAERRLSVWYSAPSILALLAEHGGLDRPGALAPAPRLVLFAGEVFPIAPLRRLRALWPTANMWNLYGPTETNVCTAEPIPSSIPPDYTTPFPIGRACPPLQARVVDAVGRDVAAGTMGELLIAGPGVMRGYFGQPELTAQAFFRDDRGDAWYRTGDLVVDNGHGSFTFHGRRDRMIKKRGYRIELGEIESALHRHEGVERAAVVARDGESGVAITAFVAMKPDHKKSIVAMKRHCTVYLPHYMVPDSITFLSSLPTTSTDKVDYQDLKRLVGEPAP